MNGFRPVAALQRTIQEFTQDVLKQRFFHDRLSMFLLFLAGGINGGSLVNLALKLQPVEGEVPVHFSSFTLFDQLGPWYFPLEIAVAAAGITIVNGFFAYHSFARSRLSSFFLLVTSVVVAVFAFVIAQAFGGVR